MPAAPLNGSSATASEAARTIDLISIMSVYPRAMSLKARPPIACLKKQSARLYLGAYTFTDDSPFQKFPREEHLHAGQ
jgi:hypothetical protein